MGSALAQAFLMEGSRTTVWNRTPDKAETLAAQGAVAAGTVAEAIAASPLIVICVLDDVAVQKILGPGRPLRTRRFFSCRNLRSSSLLAAHAAMAPLPQKRLPITER